MVRAINLSILDFKSQLSPALSISLQAINLSILDFKFRDQDRAWDKVEVGILGQRHLQYIKAHRKGFYTTLLTKCELNRHLADVNKQAEDMFFRLIKQMAERDGVTEQLKAENQMLWVRKMNNIRNRATEIVNVELIYN